MSQFSLLLLHKINFFKFVVLLDRAHRIHSHAIGLPNQTFRIKGQFYTLLNRLGSGKFASVWESTTQNGNY